MGNSGSDSPTNQSINSVAMRFILDELSGEIIDLWASSAESEEEQDDTTNKTKKDDDTVQG